MAMKRATAAAMILVLAAFGVRLAWTGETASTLAAAKGVEGMEKATFAAGCFWGVEASFRKVEGIVSTRVGYTGGITENPTYEDVCSHRTGHAEAVEVTYDPDKLTYDQLLDVFWRTHDPTQKHRQGPDVGSQYRSAIFYHSDAQKSAALASKERLTQSGKHRKPVVTEIAPASTFWQAEEYHQQYMEKHGLGASCHI